MTVKQVIATLSHFHEDAEAYVTWEGVRVGLNLEDFYMGSGSLYIDADKGMKSYKEDIVSGKRFPKK